MSLPVLPSPPAASLRYPLISWTAVPTPLRFGYNSVTAARTALNFAEELEFAQQAAEAGCVTRKTYVQVLTRIVTGEPLWLSATCSDVKLNAIDNLHPPASRSCRL